MAEIGKDEVPAPAKETGLFKEHTYECVEKCYYNNVLYAKGSKLVTDAKTVPEHFKKIS